MENILNFLNSMPMQGTEWIITTCFIVLDVLVGTCHAWATKTISSVKARQGVMHKMGFLGAMLLCTLIDVAQAFLDLGFVAPTLTLCCIMICLTEVFSICEHIQEMNPEINLHFLESNGKDEHRNEHAGD